MIRLEFTARELGRLRAPGSVDIAEQMFARAVSEKLVRIGERDRHRYL
jgi:hypothetical protein